MEEFDDDMSLEGVPIKQSTKHTPQMMTLSSQSASPTPVYHHSFFDSDNMCACYLSRCQHSHATHPNSFDKKYSQCSHKSQALTQFISFNSANVCHSNLNPSSLMCSSALHLPTQADHIHTHNSENNMLNTQNCNEEPMVDRLFLKTPHLQTLSDNCNINRTLNGLNLLFPSDNNTNINIENNIKNDNGFNNNYYFSETSREALSCIQEPLCDVKTDEVEKNFKEISVIKSPALAELKDGDGHLSNKNQESMNVIKENNKNNKNNKNNSLLDKFKGTKTLSKPDFLVN